MVEIDWSRLRHAYGDAAGIPALIQQLENFPAEAEAEREPWFGLWSALCHQGDVYSASFAAVVMMSPILASAPERATCSFFALPACIEIARENQGLVVPGELAPLYRTALDHLTHSALAYLRNGDEPDTRAAALALIAAASGSQRVADLILEVQDDALDDVLEWLRSR
ncbi:hypothetical protein [Pseudoxanthomonas sp.]|uniref:hypothetical protein n=1 Tax=Pseudoxanthomonas sp. TaxID=1871049 RepID=UPI003F7F52B3